MLVLLGYARLNKQTHFAARRTDGDRTTEVLQRARLITEYCRRAPEAVMYAGGKYAGYERSADAPVLSESDVLPTFCNLV